MTRPVRFIHISDTHIGPAVGFRLYDRSPLEEAERLVQTINALPFQPDFVVHTGDITAFPDEDAYRLADQVLGRIKYPVYYVTGNHDASAMVRSSLRQGPARFEGQERHTYSFEVGGIRFLALDARGPDSIDPHGLLPDTGLEILRRAVNGGGPPLVVFIHFPLLPVDSLWFDRDMLLLNGEEVHEVLRSRPGAVRGVFFGHVHRGMQVHADGVLYSSVGSSFRQFFAHPFDDSVQLDSAAGPRYDIVTVSANRTTVKEHTVC